MCKPPGNNDQEIFLRCSLLRTLYNILSHILANGLSSTCIMKYDSYKFIMRV